jgi:F0F1-type ATP synthase gamma subunit
MGALAVHRSRLAAMEAAERNIDDRIDDLTRR